MITTKRTAVAALSVILLAGCSTPATVIDEEKIPESVKSRYDVLCPNNEDSCKEALKQFVEPKEVTLESSYDDLCTITQGKDGYFFVAPKEEEYPYPLSFFDEILSTEYPSLQKLDEPEPVYLDKNTGEEKKGYFKTTEKWRGYKNVVENLNENMKGGALYWEASHGRWASAETQPFSTPGNPTPDILTHQPDSLDEAEPLDCSQFREHNPGKIPPENNLDFSNSPIYIKNVAVDARKIGGDRWEVYDKGEPTGNSYSEEEFRKRYIYHNGFYYPAEEYRIIESPWDEPTTITLTTGENRTVEPGELIVGDSAGSIANVITPDTLGKEYIHAS